MKESVQRDVDDFAPLCQAHPGHHRIVMHAGIVDQHLYRPACQQLLQRLLAALGIGNVKLCGLRAAAVPFDQLDRILRARGVRVAVHDHMQAVPGKALRDSGSESAAGARDESNFFHQLFVDVRSGSACLVDS